MKRSDAHTKALEEIASGLPGNAAADLAARILYERRYDGEVQCLNNTAGVQCELIAGHKRDCDFKAKPTDWY